MFQPRYIAYACSNGNSPDRQMEADRMSFPGGVMCGFILFIASELRAFREAEPESFIGSDIRDQSAFTRFIQSRIRTPNAPNLPPPPVLLPLPARTVGGL